MYTLTKTFAQRNGAGSVWEEVDAGPLSLATLFSTYREIRIEVHESYSNKQQVIDMNTLRKEFLLESSTMTEWLIDIDNRNLRGTDGSLSLVSKGMWSYDCITVGFLPKIGNTNYHPTNSIPFDEQTDILLTRPETNYTNVGKHCLFTVRGYVHRHEYGSVGVYVIGGNSTTVKSGSTEIGMLDFSRIGELETYAIESDSLAAPTSMLPYKESVYLKLPRALEKGETLGLVLGGYFHLADDSYHAVSSIMAKINMQAMSIHERYFRSRHFLDMSSLDVDADAKDVDSDIIATRLSANETIAAWLTHPNSFWVYIKADSLQVTQETLPRPCTPGRYFLGRVPEGALRVDFGELPAFIQTYEKPIWLLSTKWEQRKNTLFETTGYKDSRVKVLNDTPYLRKPYDQSMATLMQIRHVELVMK